MQGIINLDWVKSEEYIEKAQDPLDHQFLEANFREGGRLLDWFSNFDTMTNRYSDWTNKYQYNNLKFNNNISVKNKTTYRNRF